MRRRMASLLGGISRSSMVKKALLIYVLFIFLPSCLLMYGYYRKTSAILEREMSASMLQTLKQAEYNISGRLELIENISDGFIANPDIFGFLSDLNKPSYLQYGDFQTLEKLVGSAERNRDVRQIRVFVQPELLYASEAFHFFSLREVENEPWYARTKSRNGAVHWSGAHRQTYLGGDAAYVASAARVLHDPKNYEKVIGALVVDVREDMLRQILSHIELAPSQDVFMMDRDGLIVSARNQAAIGKPSDLTAEQIRLVREREDGFFKSELEGEGLTVLYRHIPLADWTIVARLPSAAMSGESVALTKISAVIALAAFSIVFIFILVLAFAYAAERLSRRIRELILTLKTEGIGRLDSSSSDLQELEQGVARMVQTVHDLTAESYQAKLLERDAQLNALQAQINPHFLYNTLDSIHWMAIRRKADDISDMIESLSAYFRQSLSKGRFIVTLEEELQLIRSYMHIQNKRNDDGIQTVILVDDAALLCSIPKMIIQPLVENSVQHGIHQKRPKHGTITIAAAVTDDKLSITVQDDGVGIAPERLERLLEAPAAPAAVQNFGLYNVHERIRLYSRNEADCGLTIASEPGVGTRVSLLVKVTDSRPDGDGHDH